jgi:hypothetical protein
MKYCRLCEADAFIKSSLGSKVILDCGHIADGDKAASRPRGGPTSREVWLEMMRKRGVTIKDQPAAPKTLCGDCGEDVTKGHRDGCVQEHRQEERAPKPTPTFDPQAAARTIVDLLKRRES